MSVSLGELIDGLTVLQDVYGHNARIVSVDEDSILYTHKNEVHVEDFTDVQMANLANSGWYFNTEEGTWEIQL